MDGRLLKALIARLQDSSEITAILHPAYWSLGRLMTHGQPELLASFRSATHRCKQTDCARNS